VVYVDNDPMVLAHAPALLVGSSPDSTAYIQGDCDLPESVVKTLLDARWRLAATWPLSSRGRGSAQ
jgi:hypothetical protein